MERSSTGARNLLSSALSSGVVKGEDGLFHFEDADVKILSESPVLAGVTGTNLTGRRVRVRVAAASGKPNAKPHTWNDFEVDLVNGVVRRAVCEGARDQICLDMVINHAFPDPDEIEELVKECILSAINLQIKITQEQIKSKCPSRSRNLMSLISLPVCMSDISSFYLVSSLRVVPTGLLILLSQIRLTPSSYRGDAKRFGERHCLKSYGIPNQFWRPKSDFPTQEEIIQKVDYLLDMGEGLPFLQGDPEMNHVSSFQNTSWLLTRKFTGRNRFFASGSEGADPEVLLRKEVLRRQSFRSA